MLALLVFSSINVEIMLLLDNRFKSILYSNIDNNNRIMKFQFIIKNNYIIKKSIYSFFNFWGYVYWLVSIASLHPNDISIFNTS